MLKLRHFMIRFIVGYTHIARGSAVAQLSAVGMHAGVKSWNQRRGSEAIAQADALLFDPNSHTLIAFWIIPYISEQIVISVESMFDFLAIVSRMYTRVLKHMRFHISTSSRRAHFTFNLSSLVPKCHGSYLYLSKPRLRVKHLELKCKTTNLSIKFWCRVKFSDIIWWKRSRTNKFQSVGYCWRVWIVWTIDDDEDDVNLCLRCLDLWPAWKSMLSCYFNWDLSPTDDVTVCPRHLLQSKSRVHQ